MSGPLASISQHVSYNDCLDYKTEDCQNCSVLYCVTQLCTIICTLIWTVLLLSTRQHPSLVIVWRLRVNIIRTALCWIVWHNVHSRQHTYVSSSYRSNSLSRWDPYTVHRGGCLELYYCNMVEWFWWDSSLIFDDQLVSFSALTLLVWSSGL